MKRKRCEGKMTWFADRRFETQRHKKTLVVVKTSWFRVIVTVRQAPRIRKPAGISG